MGDERATAAEAEEDEAAAARGALRRRPARKSCVDDDDGDATDSADAAPGRLDVGIGMTPPERAASGIGAMGKRKPERTKKTHTRRLFIFFAFVFVEREQKGACERRDFFSPLFRASKKRKTGKKSHFTHSLFLARVRSVSLVLSLSIVIPLSLSLSPLLKINK